MNLSRAFDLVSYDIFWGKLKKARVSLDVKGVVKFWYGNQVNQVKREGVLSDPYTLKCGVRQGGLTSPRLFNTCRCHIGSICVNSYADDMMPLALFVGALRQLISMCESYANPYGFVYNCKKIENIAVSVFCVQGYNL